MHPVLFTLGSVDVHTYGVMGALGFVVVAFLSIRRGAALGVVKERVADVIFWTAVAGIVGSRLVYVAQNLAEFHTLADVANLRSGGLVFYGALFTGLPVAAYCLYRFKMPFFPMMDVFATGLPIAHAISRLGCFAAGCCYGKPTHVPWAVTFTDDLAVAPHGIPLHPTQLYEAAYLFAIGGFVNWLYPRKRYDGQVMLTYLVLYAVCRPINEFLRDDADRGYFLPDVFGQSVTFSQGLSVVLAVGAIAVFAVVARKNAGQGAPVPASADAIGSGRQG